MSQILNPGLLAIVAIIAAVALASSGSPYAVVPVVAWMAYVIGLVIYAKGRDDERFEREHPKRPR